MMIDENVSKHLPDDIAHAFGAEASQLWQDYCRLRDRLAPEVEAGRYPALGPKDVGLLYRLVRDLGLEAPMEFRMAQNRMTIDKDHYGSAIVGMGDLLAIRSIESHVASRVEYKVAESISEPLVRKIVSSIRQAGYSKGASRDIDLAKQTIAFGLAAVGAMAMAQNGNVTSTDIERLAQANGIEHLEFSR